jgi:hypothetical protein
MGFRGNRYRSHAAVTHVALAMLRPIIHAKTGMFHFNVRVLPTWPASFECVA